MKKRLISTIIALFLIFMIVPAHASLTVSYTEIVPPKYDDIRYNYEDLFMMCVAEKWGIIDKNGTELVPPIYDDISYFSEGLAVVRVGDWDTGRKFGVVDTMGNLVVPPIYNRIDDFSEGLAVFMNVIDDAYVYGYIDTTGSEAIVLPENTQGAYSFSEGLACVVVYNQGDVGLKYGYIDKDGKEVIPFAFDMAGEFSEGLARVAVLPPDGRNVMNEGKWGFIDKSGREVVPPIYSFATDFSEGLAAVSVGGESLGYGGKWGFIDASGREVIPLIYDGVLSFSEGFARVTLDEKWGLLDKNGNVVVPLEYGYIRDFYEGLAVVEVGEWSVRKFGVFDMKGNLVVPLIYDYIHNFYEGLAAVIIDGKYGFIDKTGNVVIPGKYDSIEYFHTFYEGLAPVRLDDKLYMIDKDGNELISLPYDYIEVEPETGVAATIRYNGDESMYGLISIPSYTANTDTPAPSGPTAGAASWAIEGLEEALENGLVIDSMIGNWTRPTSRLLAADAVVRLIEVTTGDTIDAIAAENGYDMTDKFSDTDNKSVTFLKAAGISNGVDGTRYDPNGTFTRAQMVTMLGRMAENILGIDFSGSPLGTDVFSDVPDWASVYVGWAAQAGITDGVGGGRFDSNGTLQNQHTGVFANRAYKHFMD